MGSTLFPFFPADAGCPASIAEKMTVMAAVLRLRIISIRFHLRLRPIGQLRRLRDAHSIRRWRTGFLFSHPGNLAHDFAIADCVGLKGGTPCLPRSGKQAWLVERRKTVVVGPVQKPPFV